MSRIRVIDPNKQDKDGVIKILSTESQSKLNDDLSNLSEVSYAELSRALNSPRRNEVIHKLKELLFEKAKNGDGIEFDTLPEPYKQKGLQCQTIALLNGINAVGEGQRLRSYYDIQTLAKRIRNRTQLALKPKTGKIRVKESVLPRGSEIVDEGPMLTVKDVSRQFNELGIPLKHIMGVFNPVQLTEQLFKERRFAVIVERNHAYVLLPIQNVTQERFTAKVDSLQAPFKKVISLDSYLDTVLNHYKSHDAEILIFEIEKPRIKVK